MKPSEFHAMTAPDAIAREWEPTDAELHELFWSPASLRTLEQCSNNVLTDAPVITVRRVAALEQRQRQEAEARRFLQTGESRPPTFWERMEQDQQLRAQQSSLASFPDRPTVHVELQVRDAGPLARIAGGSTWVRVPDTFGSRGAAEAYCQRMRAVQPHIQWRVEDESR